MNGFYTQENFGAMAHPSKDVNSVGSILKNARTDGGLHERLRGNPYCVLSEYGIGIPKGIELNVVANSTDTYHLIIPPDPNSSLSEESLEIIAGGGHTASVATLPSTISCIVG